MITNTAKTILVDGVCGSNVAYKRSFSDVGDNLLTLVADGKGGYLGAGVITITGEIKGYFIKPIILHEVTVYNIYGVSTPGDRLIYLSAGFEEGNIDALKNNVIATTYADAEGNFEFTNVSNPDGVVSLWTDYLAQDATTASLTYELSVTDYNPNIGDLITYSFNEPKGEHQHPQRHG